MRPDYVLRDSVGNIEDVELVHVGDGLWGVSQRTEQGTLERVIISEAMLESLTQLRVTERLTVAA
jgi:hypothetical protein